MALAQLRVLHGLVAGTDPPLLGAARRAAFGEPRVDETALGGVPATLYRPARGRGPWPAMLIYSGATRRGRMHPAFQGLGRALAATGHLAAVCEPTGVSVAELQPGTLDDALAAARALAGSPQTGHSAVGLAGVSVGAMVALVAAAEADLAERVSVVLVLAPCCDVALATRVVTTDTCVSRSGLVRFVPGGFSRLVIARSLVASLPESTERDALRRLLLALPDDAADPLAPLRAQSLDELGEPARATVALLANEEPDRFDELYAALPETLRAAVARISPIGSASGIRAPVEVVVGREDKYLPLADAEAFVAACPTARLTVLDSLAHAVPRPSVRHARDVALLDGALVRAFSAARTHR
jgi:pimeloyl-ACP methyl ester carboxylesterase